MTIEEFERLPDDGSRMELVRGQLVREPPAGFEHSSLGVEIAAILRQFVRGQALGKVVGSDAGFVLFDEPPTVRAPDVAFVAEIRLLTGDEELDAEPVLPGFRVNLSEVFGG